jgi:Mg2+ and Co2+ transporter CorA
MSEEKILELWKVYDFRVCKVLDELTDQLAREEFKQDLVEAFYKCKRLDTRDMKEMFSVADWVASLDYIYYKGKFITRADPLRPLTSAIVLVKLVNKIVFYNAHQNLAIFVTKEEMIENLKKMIEEDEKQLKEFEKKLKKRPNSKYYQEMIEMYKRSIQHKNSAINWLQEEL